MDIAEVLKRAKAPERTVDLCLDANLRGDHEHLERQLLLAQRVGAVSGQSAEAKQIAQQIRDLEERMQSSTVTFRMRGLSAFRRDEWFAENSPRKGKEDVEGFNPITGLPSLIAACCIDPVMTVEQARELCEGLGTKDSEKLFAAAFEATNGDSDVPFSVAASVTLRGSEQKRK